MTKSYGLGRLVSPDPRDRSFLMASVLKPEVIIPPHRYWWSNGWKGDQGDTSQCVAYAWLHWLATAPKTAKVALIEPTVLYRRAQELDSFEGENYEGTDTRGGAKAMQEKGFIESYHWADDFDTVVNAVLTTSPVVVGTTWYSGMFEPNSKGFIKPTGSNEGGHAYLINGVNRKKKIVRLQNSWGTEWGLNGMAYMTFDDFERLLTEDGEAVLGIETRP